MELAAKNPGVAREIVEARPAVEFAVANNLPLLEAAMADEERAERQRDREYWQPLKAELEQLRHRRTS